MLLFIDTTDYEQAMIALVGKRTVLHQFQAHDLSEKLAVEIEKFIKKQKIRFSQIKKTAVVTGPGGFSKIRTGVATANALAFALKIPIVGISSQEIPGDLSNLQSKTFQKMVAPVYGRAPSISTPKNKK